MNKKLLALHNIFFRKFFLLFITIFLILGIIVYFWIKQIYLDQIKIDLLHNIDIISLQINKPKNSNKLAKKIHKNINLRVTIIDDTGVVIAESNKDYKLMENHINRIEIVQARQKEYGSVIRYSQTIKKELLYVAKRFKIQNNYYYIRMARDTNSINDEFIYLSFKIAFIFLLFTLFSFYISLNISKDIQIQTIKILDFLREITKSKKEISIKSNYSKEFNNITKLLTYTSKELTKKNKQKTKYTAKLKLANKQKDDIISAISHEFKNPIAVISGYTQTLLDDPNINPNISNKFLNKISSNVNKMTTMIDRLRLAIKLEEKKQTLDEKEINIKSFINNIIEDIKLIYPNRIINTNIDNIIIEADETLLNIAISNIIENALKYSSENIDLVVNNNTISIRDYGIGISLNDIKKITTKFYRVSSNSWNNSLGLGLSLVKNILELHNFQLEIQSEENKGSIFIINI